MSTLPLFGESKPALQQKLSQPLQRLAAENIFIGTSSWKYEGWLEQIYTPERYSTRGKFSQKKFEAECLAEYAETFPVVCGDFSFYQFPTIEFWRRLFSQTPPEFRYALKVPEEITVARFPDHTRYGGKRGSLNPNFLDINLLVSEFLDLLEPYQERVAVLIFEFGAFPPGTFANVEDFLRVLLPALKKLPDWFRYSVEIRNPEFLGDQYFEALRAAGVSHVFNAWTRMPTIAQQMAMPGAFTTNFSVVRALLKQGRTFEESKAMFSPYRRVQEVNHELREALRQLIARGRRRTESVFIFANNRIEGNAPGTIEAVVGE